MGVDITLYAEIYENGQWQPIPKETTTHWRTGQPFPIEPSISFVRPYELFAVLAGAATYKIHSVGTKIETISEPRGLPQDMNWFYKESFNEEELECTFCHSWLLLKEIINFDWDNKFITHEIYVEPQNAHLFKHDKGFPHDSFPKNGLLKYPYFLLDKKTTNHNKNKHLSLVSWKESYREFVGCSEQLIKELLELGEPDRVRIIFWFDA